MSDGVEYVQERRRGPYTPRDLMAEALPVVRERPEPGPELLAVAATVAGAEAAYEAAQARWHQALLRRRAGATAGPDGRLVARQDDVAAVAEAADALEEAGRRLEDARAVHTTLVGLESRRRALAAYAADQEAQERARAARASRGPGGGLLGRLRAGGRAG